MTTAAPAAGFDPNAPGTAEAHWEVVLDELARTVEVLDLLPPGSDLVVLSAHPDDESLAAGGLIAAAHALGRGATLVVATSGEASHPRSLTHPPDRLATIREGEVRQALEALHPQARLVLLRLPDGALSEHREALAASLAAAVGPRTVVAAPWRRDGHTDHDTAGSVAAEVVAAAGATLLEYPLWLWHWGTGEELAGGTVVRVPLDTGAVTRRTEAQQAHASQVRALSDEPGDEVLLPPHVVERFTRTFEVFVVSRPAVASEVDPDLAFDAMFERSDDPWCFETSWYEQRKRAVTLAALPRRSLGRVLEVGCSTGVLTAELATRATSVLGTDLSGEAVRRARERVEALDGVTITQLRSPQQWPSGDFDLVVLSEIGYFWQPHELESALTQAVASLADDGILLLCHWRHPVSGWPLDGDAVHAAAVALPGLRTVVSHVEADFRLDVLAAGSWRSPAEVEGLT